MTDLINGRTPEEIKRVLDWANCACGDMDCEECQYHESVCSHENFERIAPDALALIQRLESERDAALAKVPKWISVEERLPSQNGDYLIHYRFKNQGKGKGFYSVCFYERTCEKPHFHNEGYCGMYVTHWMPQPEPPKEDA